MASATSTRATLDDLYRVEGKAELIGGRIVQPMASGVLPTLVAANIYRQLHEYNKGARFGTAFPDGLGYAVPELESGRESFQPDASFYRGKLPAKRMRFIDGAPDFAVEVRSENDYGAAAEREMAAKRVDYFAAGTQVVWDVDPQAETVAIYVPIAPENPRILRKGDMGDAEPAVLGWRMSVDEIFES